MNTKELTKKHEALSCDVGDLKDKINGIKIQIGKRSVGEYIHGCKMTTFKPDLTIEIEELKETISMLFCYLDVKIQEKTTKKQIVKKGK